MHYDPVLDNGFVSADQKAVFQSSLTLKGVKQGDWARSMGLLPGELSRMVNGHLRLREDYASAINELVFSVHPVVLAA